MNYWKKNLTLLLALILTLGLTACGDIDDNYDNPNDNINQTQDVPITDMTELDGTWATTNGNRLYFDSDNGFYAYQTFYGRTGDGEILLPNQNGDVFGAGWETPVYDPAEDWGDDWADNWD